VIWEGNSWRQHHEAAVPGSGGVGRAAGPAGGVPECRRSGITGGRDRSAGCGEAAVAHGAGAPLLFRSLLLLGSCGVRAGCGKAAVAHGAEEGRARGGGGGGVGRRRTVDLVGGGGARGAAAAARGRRRAG